MSDFSGRSHLTPGKGGGTETRGGGEDGEAAERRPSGSVDGQPQGSWLGEVGEMSYGDMISCDLAALINLYQDVSFIML